jgi:hypothetical protein
MTIPMRPIFESHSGKNDTMLSEICGILPGPISETEFPSLPFSDVTTKLRFNVKRDIIIASTRG